MASSGEAVPAALGDAAEEAVPEEEGDWAAVKLSAALAGEEGEGVREVSGVAESAVLCEALEDSVPTGEAVGETLATEEGVEEGVRGEVTDTVCVADEDVDTVGLPEAVLVALAKELGVGVAQEVAEARMEAVEVLDEVLKGEARALVDGTERALSVTEVAEEALGMALALASPEAVPL